MKIHLIDGSTIEVALDTKEKNSPEKGKWLNKDRFWTLVFWFGMSLGFSIASFTRFVFEEPKLFSIIILITSFSIPLIVTLCNKTRFITKDTFENSEGVLITEKQMPHWFFIPLVIGIGLTLFVLPRQQYSESHFFASFLFWSSFFSGLSLYFIFKNCPISILFNHKFHNLEEAKKPKSSDYYYTNVLPSSRDSYARTCSLSYNYLPQNIHYRR